MNTNWKEKIRSPELVMAFRRTGVVQGSAVWSETRVSGGGGANGQAVSVSSSVVERNRFFVIEEDGEEWEAKDAPIAVRDGHRVTVVFIGQKPSTTGWPCYYYNHNTAEFRANEDTLKHKWAPPSKGWHFVAPWIAAALCGAFSAGLGWVMAIPAAFVTYTYFPRLKARKAVLTSIESAAYGLVDEAKRVLAASAAASPATEV
ncbi:hypothetical protein [Hydrogenophaga sp.]|uniref:hypothetical protein n=1 Tax=Hydrogenophaga sp. TaxID=1904254 RepID=UPI003D114970